MKLGGHVFNYLYYGYAYDSDSESYQILITDITN